MRIFNSNTPKDQASTWLQEWAVDSDMVYTWRQKHPTQEEYNWGHRQKEDYDTKQTLQEVDKQMNQDSEQEEDEVEEEKEGGGRTKPTERRIDYMAINKGRANICTSAEIMPTGWTTWSTDHKAARITIVGLKVLRREEKKSGRDQHTKPETWETQQ